jgi:hypothetical protein
VLERFNKLINNIPVYDYDTEESQEYDNGNHNDTEDNNKEKNRAKEKKNQKKVKKSINQKKINVDNYYFIKL